MPIFEFTCNDCGKQFEKIVKASADSSPECPECGSCNVSKGLSTFSTSEKASATACFSGG